MELHADDAVATELLALADVAGAEAADAQPAPMPGLQSVLALATGDDAFSAGSAAWVKTQRNYLRRHLLATLQATQGKLRPSKAR